MFALIAFVLGVIAAILHLVGKDAGIQTWLIIIAVILVSADVTWGWYRAGHPIAR